MLYLLLCLMPYALCFMLYALCCIYLLIPQYWSEIRAVVLVVSDKEKDTSSTSGMETSRLTSLLLQHRASTIVQPRLDEITKAYLSQDFETFGRITMQVHEVCI